jgi:hypothetical protein
VYAGTGRTPNIMSRVDQTGYPEPTSPVGSTALVARLGSSATLKYDCQCLTSGQFDGPIGLAAFDKLSVGDDMIATIVIVVVGRKLSAISSTACGNTLVARKYIMKDTLVDWTMTRRLISEPR